MIVQVFLSLYVCVRLPISHGCRLHYTVPNHYLPFNAVVYEAYNKMFNVIRTSSYKCTCHTVPALIPCAIVRALSISLVKTAAPRP